MMKSVQWIIERFVERTVPIVGNLFSAALQNLHALGLAEHESQLEDAARRYEAEGKPEIAASLRTRAGQLCGDDDEAVRIAKHIATPLQAHLPEKNSATDPDALPAPSATKPRSKRRKRPLPSIDTLDVQDKTSRD